MKIAMQLPNLSGRKGSLGVQRPASCRPKARLVPLTGSHWNNTRLRVIECTENEPLLAGDSQRRRADP
jgi:hypothetical protein